MSMLTILKKIRRFLRRTFRKQVLVKVVLIVATLALIATSVIPFVL